MYSQNFCERLQVELNKWLGSVISIDLNMAATPYQKLSEAAMSVLGSKQWHGRIREDGVDVRRHFVLKHNKEACSD